MLEKDIENLLAQYPSEFIPKSDLTLIRQQYPLDSKKADIIFENSKVEMIIMEVKRGLLSREGLGQFALGQAMEYYGRLRKKEPDKKIQLILVANTIPQSMTTYLKEKLDVDCLEIPDYELNKVALRHGYHFLDSFKPDLIQRYNEIIAGLELEAKEPSRNVWIFQANPQRYDILNALADESINEDVWEVNQYRNEIRAGDLGIIWMSGVEGGIYGVFDITSNPEMLKDSPESAKYWVNESEKMLLKLRVRNKIKLKLINNPVRREELKNITELQGMKIFRMPRGTNFKVSSQEWLAVLGLLKKRFEVPK
jgi:hypothetical protein